MQLPRHIQIFFFRLLVSSLELSAFIKQIIRKFKIRELNKRDEKAAKKESRSRSKKRNYRSRSKHTQSYRDKQRSRSRRRHRESSKNRYHKHIYNKHRHFDNDKKYKRDNFSHRESKDDNKLKDFEPEKSEQHKKIIKGRGFARKDDSHALLGWDEEDYHQVNKKLMDYGHKFKDLFYKRRNKYLEVSR